MAYAANNLSTLTALPVDTTADNRETLLLSSFSSYSEELRQLVRSAADWIGVQSRFQPLTEDDRSAVMTHMKSLSEDDIRLRFGFQAGDAHLHRYVDSLDFDRDCVIGIYDEKKLVAFCQLALFDRDSQKMGEVGLSILNGHRGKGYASDMMVACFAEAAKTDVQTLYINYVQSNKAMAALCRKFNAKLEFDSGDVTATMQVHDSKAPTFEKAASSARDIEASEEVEIEPATGGFLDRLFGKLTGFFGINV